MRALLLISLLLLALTGCKTQSKQKDVAGEIDRLYQVYLDGGLAEARNSLGQIIAIHHDSNLSPSAQAQGLWLAYGRLFLLEKRSGHDEDAQAALIKARYWALRRAEISGDSSADALHYVDKFASEDGMAAFFDKWDRDHNQGHLPNYTQKL
jgi:hypothetical protein